VVARIQKAGAGYLPHEVTHDDRRALEARATAAEALLRRLVDAHAAWEECSTLADEELLTRVLRLAPEARRLLEPPPAEGTFAAYVERVLDGEDGP
jgi:hypothetical protein